MIKTLLAQYIEDACSEDIRLAVEEHLSTCPECKKEYEEMTDELPPLPIILPSINQINPLKKIKKYNRIRNIIIITVVSAIVIVGAIFISKYLNFKNGKTVYCQNNPLMALEAIADSFSTKKSISNLSIVLTEKEGNILDNNNHYFEIYDNDKKQCYQVSDEEIGNFHSTCLKIIPTASNKTDLSTFSLTKTITIIKSVLEKEVFDENKLEITIYAYNRVLNYEVEYYYDAINDTFIDENVFAKYAGDHNICIIKLVEPKVEPPEEGVIMGDDLLVVSIAVFY